MRVPAAVHALSAVVGHAPLRREAASCVSGFRRGVAARSAGTFDSEIGALQSSLSSAPRPSSPSSHSASASLQPALGIRAWPCPPPLPCLWTSIRFLRQRVLPSSLPSRRFSVENPETARSWPPQLEKEEQERREAFLQALAQPTGENMLLCPPQCLPHSRVYIEKLMEEEARLRLYRHLKKEEQEAAALTKQGSWAGAPLADTPAAKMQPLVGRKCRETLRHLQEAEIERLEKQRNFQVPLFGVGDLMEVKYELSRSQQTFATFQGYCVEVRKKRLNSSFVLRNSYEGTGVEQRIPLYSPRIISLKVVSSCASPTQDFLSQRHKPLTRDYRYKWKYNFRGRWSRRIGKHKPGIRSVEKKIRQRIVRIRKRYMGLRIEAGLPPYVWGGPYPQYGRKRSLFIRGEMYRRMLIYSFDERRRRAEKLRMRREAVKWGVFKLRQPTIPPALTALPTYHPLYPGNLPK
ncbi:ribosomal protein L19 protein [Besnoitia besnoiti]|uniref:50S ribosomal protein L19, chloroplastic n=1 Tax=Besnoitia besnoiti TaxID=94643 RepID=A0A2A9MG26_BESBE|nr:ribosomal protein L19 protein [Besnoitia besnoiti]PFH34340.1 ribosomal protein L19 protein [Besnoitia besnoiti]